MRKFAVVLSAASLLIALPAWADEETAWTKPAVQMSILPWIEDTTQLLQTELNYYPKSGNFPKQICLKVNGSEKFSSQLGLELPVEKSWLSQIVDVYAKDIVLTKAQSRAFYLDNAYESSIVDDQLVCQSIELQESRDKLIGGNNDGNSKNDFAGGVNFSFNLETRRLSPGNYSLQFSLLPDDGTVIPPLEVNVKKESGYALHDPWSDWQTFPKLKSQGPTKTITVGTGKARTSIKLKLTHKSPIDSCGTLVYTYKLGDSKTLKDYFLTLEIYHPNKSIAGRLPIYSDTASRGEWEAGVMLCPYKWYEDVLQTGALNEYQKASPGRYTGVVELSHVSKKDWKTRFTLNLTK